MLTHIFQKTERSKNLIFARRAPPESIDTFYFARAQRRQKLYDDDDDASLKVKHVNRENVFAGHVPYYTQVGVDVVVVFNIFFFICIHFFSITSPAAYITFLCLSATENL